MTGEAWPRFDRELRIRLREQDTTDSANKVCEGNESADLGKDFGHLTKCVQDTIREIIPAKKWRRKNGRVVTAETQRLFERRSKEFQKKKPTRQRRKTWNKAINNACKNDYRRWVANWVQEIEKADEKGDTKAIYKGVQALSGKPHGTTAKPTMRPAKRLQALDLSSSGSEAKVSGPAISTDGKATIASSSPASGPETDTDGKAATASSNPASGPVTDTDGKKERL